MLTDRYDLPLSTASSAARDAYVQGCEAKLTMYPGAIEAFDRAIAADSGFAVACDSDEAMMCSGLMPMVAASWSPAAGPETRFILGEPMKPATKRLSGLL